MRVHLPHLIGKIICGSSSSRVSSRWFKLFPEKILVGWVILGLFWKIMGKIWAKTSKFHNSGTAHRKDLVDPSF